MEQPRRNSSKFNVGVITYLLDLEEQRFAQLFKLINKVRSREREEISRTIARILRK